jgi:hypothetical protein
MIKFERVWAMPSANTFSINPIAALLQEEMFAGGVWVDPFANSNRLADITNDLNPEFDTDYHLDALEFLKLMETASADGVLFDPPYSSRQVSECYKSVGMATSMETTQGSFWGKLKVEVARIVKPGGKAICFGWNSGGIGKTLGFDMNRILLVPHGGIHYDTIVTVEKKIIPEPQLF